MVNIVSQILLIPAFLHYWSTREYGEWLVIFSIPSLLWTLDNGLSGLAANRMTVASGAGDWKLCNLIFHNVLVIQGSLSLLILLVAGWYAVVGNTAAAFGFKLMSRTEAGEVLFALIAYMLLGYGLGLMRAAYRASALEARGVSIANGGRLTDFLAQIAVLMRHGHALHLALALLASMSFWVLFSIFDVRRRCPNVTFALGPLSREQFGRMMVDGLPVMAGTAAGAFFLQGYPLIVNSVLGPVAVVTLTAIRTASRTLLQLTGIVTNASVSEMARTYGSRDWEGYLRLLKVLLAVTFWTSIGVGLGLTVAGPWIIGKWTSGRVLVDHPLMLLFAISVACQSGWNACGSILFSTNMHHAYNYVNLALTVVGLAAADVAIRGMGFMGVPTVMMTVDLFLLVISLWLCARNLSFVPLGPLLTVFDPRFYVRKADYLIRAVKARPSAVAEVSGRSEETPAPERKLKILAISHMPNDENAGASRIYHLLARGLRERGHTVKMLHYDDLKIAAPFHYLVKRIALPETIAWRFSREAASGYDIVFASNGVAHRIFHKLRTQSPRPRLVNHLHGASYLDFEATLIERSRGHIALSHAFMAFKSHYAASWDVRGAQEADVVITQSTRDADYMNDRRESKGCHFTAPVVRIPAPLHPGIGAASKKAFPPEKRDPFSILWFGTWGERKGSHYVNRAFRLIKGHHPQATLTLGGTGESPEVVLGNFDPALRPSIRILPRIDLETQLAEYNRHAIFIFPSLSEGFGLALIEAMAMGLACVTTSTGMMGDWIVDRQDAIMVPSNSSEHLANGVLQLMADEDLRAKIARNGQRLAQTFTLDRFVQGYLDVFQATVAAARNGA